MEAKDLITCGGAFSINDGNELKELLDKLLLDNNYLKDTGHKAGSYVSSRIGATDIILKHIKNS